MANSIYSATYSNVPVYEYTASPGMHIMRRRSDDWVNATHILKAAGFDKPARTRILEREVQKGVHEKVQGGYGKFQGTWIPLVDGRGLAERNNVLPQLAPIFDFVPGDFSPPAAPKHTTAASNKPRAPRQSMAKKLAAAAAKSAKEEQQYNAANVQHYTAQTPDAQSIMSESMMDEDPFDNLQYPSSMTRKRKRDEPDVNMQDQEHQIWADGLLDYFMLADSSERLPAPPALPPTINLERPIDDKGHCALHWAAAMGDIDVVRNLLDNGARIDVTSHNLETPLMRAVMFTNNWDRQTMTKLVRLLQPSTVVKTDWFGSTVFHHIAATTSSKNKYLPARYYLDTIINVLAETWVPDEITRLLNLQDQNGDTAIHIAARNGARKCVRSLLGRSVALDIPNVKGELADGMIRELNSRRRANTSASGPRGREASSSPFATDRVPLNGDGIHAPAVSTIVVPQYKSQTANGLLNRIVPAFMAKMRSLATAYETEFQEKESEAIENEHVVKKRRVEIDALQKQVFDQQASFDRIALELAATNETPEQEKAREEAELAELEVQALSLMELEQRDSLARSASKILSQPHGKISMGPPSANGNSGLPTDDSPASRQALTSKLAAAQAERQRLTQEIVRSMSHAGLGERQADYKRLIHGALGVREEELEGMLDDMLAQLEEERRDRLVLGEA